MRCRQDRPRRRRVREGAHRLSIGGVSPVGHATKPVVLIDRELFRFDDIWAAAGHPHAVFQLKPQDLETLTGAPVADVV
jgi:prolyl-tRNA editing enzyme YbaK/EbsC (Cys-tRNA(Pro) deacylase)